jgi:hypothetical protein
MFSLNQLNKIVADYETTKKYTKDIIDAQFKEHICNELSRLRDAKKMNWSDDYALREARKILRDSDFIKHPNNSK